MTKDTVQVCRPFGDKLDISFQRTIRVPDGKGESELPPDMGSFPLYSAADYQETLPKHMAIKGGAFFPIYQREAMWIRFNSPARFAINIYLGGVNAVSGEPLVENTATVLRRINLKSCKKSLQDYVVTPQQLWLDGIANTEGIVRQFVAMFMGSGYSVEAQLSGEESVGGLQFCITPAIRETKKSTDEKSELISITVKTFCARMVSVDLPKSASVEDLKAVIYAQEGMPIDMQRLIYDGKQLQDHLPLHMYGINNSTLLHVVYRLRGGYLDPDPAGAEMGIAPGGLIKQCILEDVFPATSWDSERIIMFHVQILNSELFQAVTGKVPPMSPISAETYAEHGLPFYKIYNEESNIKGDFRDIKSVVQMDKIKDDAGTGKEEYKYEGQPTHSNPIILLDPKGFPMKFRSVHDLEKDLSRMQAFNL